MGICGKRARWQLISTLEVSIMSLTHGISLGWLSPNLPILSSSDSPLGKPLTIEDVMWIGSLLGVGSLLTNMTICFMISFFGLKKCMYFVAIPNIIHWILIWVADNPYYLYVARALLGISGGILVVCFPIFIAEISDSNVRGTLTAIFMLALCGGVTVGFVLVFFVPFYILPCVVVILPLVYMILLIFLPESPQYLLKRGDEEKSKSSFFFYKNLKDDPENEAEANKQFETFRDRIISGGITEKITCRDFCNSVALKAFGLIAVLLICNQMSGSFAIFNYTASIFKELGSTIKPEICAMIMGVVQLFGLVSAVFLVDRVGRKLLLIPTLAGMGLCELGVGLLKFFASEEFLNAHSWIGLVLLCCVAFLSSAGIIALTFVIIVELLPVKIRAPGTSLSMCGLSCAVFVALLTFPPVIHYYGLAVAMFMASAFCFVGMTIMGFLLPETRDKSLTH